MNRAVIYARYSCEKQTELSIDGQLDVCTNFAKSNGFEIVDTYIDRAISGRTDKRPRFQDMLCDSSKKLFDAVIVYKIDRFARNQYDSVVHRKQLKDNNVTLLSATENITDSPESALLLSVLEGISEWYSADLRAKITRTIRIKMRDKGEFCGGIRTYGYDIVDKKYVINEEEAKNIRYIYKQAIDGRHLIDIKKELNVNINIYKVIPNIKYKGSLQLDGEEFEHRIPAIVDEKTWIEANKAVKATECVGYHPKSKYALSFKVYCGECQTRYVGESAYNYQRVRYRYYRPKCNCHTRIKADWLENTIVDYIVNLIKKDDLRDIAQKALDIFAKESGETQLASLKAKIRANETKIDNLIDYIAENGKSAEITSKLKDLQIQNDDLRVQLTNYNKTHLTADQIVNYLKSYLCSENVKEMILEKLIKKVEIYNDCILIYCFNGDLDTGSCSSSSESPPQLLNELSIKERLFVLKLNS